jgi:hypothetical protein
MTSKDIAAYNKALDRDAKAVCDLLLAIIEESLTKAEGKVWHGHPVWFIDGNPVAGYSQKKSGIELLFWSGKSFEVEGLTATGSFKAARAIYSSVDEVKKTLIKKWLSQAKKFQWDYANLPKNKKLIKLTSF